jgi:hypothetical protein
MTNPSASSHDLSSPMVSQPFPAERSLSVRGPPSLASRSTTTRRHRSNRSHHGGSSYQPQNEFPNFAHTGDVEIIVSAGGLERRYVLHRLYLARCSGFFEAGTSEEWSRGQAQGHGIPQGTERALGSIGEEEEGSQVGATSRNTYGGQKPFWRYELDTGTHDDEVPMLVQKVSHRIGSGSLSQSQTDSSSSQHNQRCLAETRRLGRHPSATNLLRRRMDSSDR